MYKRQPVYENAGVTITKKGLDGIDAELVDMFQGETFLPEIATSFLGEGATIDSLKQYLIKVESLEEGAQKNQLKNQWTQVEEYWMSNRLTQKYNNLVSKSIFVSTLEAKRKYQEDNSSMDFDFAFIPFSSLADSTIAVSESDLSNYLKENKKRFKFDSGRMLDYVFFDVLPSKVDSAFALKEAQTATKGFREALNDTAFFSTNSDGPARPVAYDYADIPAILRADSALLQKGYVKGPILGNDSYEIYKVIGKQTDDVVESSHILIAYNGDTAQAKLKAQSILSQAIQGADFATLAQNNSDDTNSGRQGGGLGAAAKGQGLVAPFENALFAATEVGIIPELIETQFGFHIINVTKTAYNPNKTVIVKITKKIQPSKKTREAQYRKASIFAKGIDNIEQLKAKVDGDDQVDLAESTLLTRKSALVGSITNAEPIVSWAFGDDVEIGDVSELFTIGDKYVIASLKRIADKDNPKVDDAREAIKLLVLNREKGKKLKEILESEEGDLNERVNSLNKKYGNEYARYGNVRAHKFSNNHVKEVGISPKMVGIAMAQDISEWSKAMVGEQGVFIVRTKKKTEATEVADYNSSKKAIESELSTREIRNIPAAIQDQVGVEDKR